MKDRKLIEENINKIVLKEPTQVNLNTARLQIEMDILRVMLDIRDLLINKQK